MMIRVSSALSLVAAVAVSASLSAAHAADLPTHKDAPAPPAAAPAPINWGGLYVEGFAGGSWANSSQGYGVASTWLSANLPALIPFVEGAGSNRMRASGGDVGFETGYNWKPASNFVLGIAGDISWTSLSGSRVTDGTLPFVGLPYSITQRLSADWRGSVRLRAGVTPLDNLLVYATGGFAFAHFSYANAFWDNLVPPFLPGTETESATFHSLRPGWTLGAGADWALSSNWSLNFEYRRSQYASFGGTGVLPLQQPPSTAYLSHSTGVITDDALRIGVAYHFN